MLVVKDSSLGSLASKFVGAAACGDGLVRQLLVTRRPETEKQMSDYPTTYPLGADRLGLCPTKEVSLTVKLKLTLVTSIAVMEKRRISRCSFERVVNTWRSCALSLKTRSKP